MPQMKFTIEVDGKLKPKDRMALGEAAIEYIKHRTLDGYDKNLDKFVPYTKSYAAKKGVGVKDVDLVFSGEMLNAMKVLSHSKGFITIGYAKKTVENAKAEGNILGTYGKKHPVSKGRDFLGIDDDELRALQDEALGEPDFSSLSSDEVDAMARRAAEEILGIDFSLQDD